MFRRDPGVTSLRQWMQGVPGPLLDVGLALVVAIAVMIAIGVAPEPGRRPDTLAYVLGLTIAALVLARRRWPVAVLVASAATLQVYYLLGFAGIRPAVPLAVALATAWAAGHPRWSLLVAVWFAGGDFTRRSELIAPEQVVEVLNDLFSVFDRLALQRGLEKIKTIGDAYMVAGGLPDPRPDHAQALAEMALAMREEVAGRSDPSGQPLAVRIGIDTGPVVAGVIGTSKFSYDLWGDTVNTASRMESYGVPGCIQVTARTYQRLRDSYRFERQGPIAVKGKGEIVTYFLVGRNQ
jgi:class 3 adenylate cyclase